MDQLRQKLSFQEMSIISADKGSGLIIISHAHLHSLYAKSTENMEQTSANQFIQSLNSLKTAIYNFNPSTSLEATDDRMPTMYFKIKIHKSAFQECLQESTTHTNIFGYLSREEDITTTTTTTTNTAVQLPQICCTHVVEKLSTTKGALQLCVPRY